MGSYLITVQIGWSNRLPPAPALMDNLRLPRRSLRKEVPMSLALLERTLDRTGGLFLLAIGLVTAGALAGICA